MRISIVAAAHAELAEAAHYYAAEAGLTVAGAFIAEFERATKLLSAHPTIGAPWRGAIRRLPLRRFPYGVVYQVLESEIRIIAVAHQRRRPSIPHGRR